MFVKLQSCRELTSLRICRRDKAKGSRKCNALLLCARLPSFPLSSIFQVEQPNVSCFNVKRKKQDVQNDKKKKKKKEKKGKRTIGRARYRVEHFVVLEISVYAGSKTLG